MKGKAPKIAPARVPKDDGSLYVGPFPAVKFVAFVDRRAPRRDGDPSLHGAARAAIVVRSPQFGTCTGHDDAARTGARSARAAHALIGDHEPLLRARRRTDAPAGARREVRRSRRGPRTGALAAAEPRTSRRDRALVADAGDVGLELIGARALAPGRALVGCGRSSTATSTARWSVSAPRDRADRNRSPTSRRMSCARRGSSCLSLKRAGRTCASSSSNARG